jgi:Tfp pilus assembly protein PilF
MSDARRVSRQVRRAEARRSATSPEREREGFPVSRLVAPLLVVAALFAYRNSLQGPFVLDDLYAIQSNESIRTLWPPWAAFSPPPHSAVTARPVTNLSLAFNYALSGYEVSSYHLFNLTVHVLSALLLFGIVLRTLRSSNVGTRYREGAVGIASTTALLWALHPLVTESVDYIIQRNELLMGFFFLLTFYGAIRGFEQPGKRRWFILSVAAFALGLGCKEVIVVAPVALLLFDWLFWSKSVPDALRRHRALYLGFAAVLALFVLVLGTRLRRAFTGLSRRMSPWHYALTQLGVIVHYLRLAVWPHPLVADYDGWKVATSVQTVLPALFLVGALVALTVWGLVRRAHLSFLGVWFFGILAPTSSFRPISLEIAAERRMYLPLVAVVLLFVLGGHALLRAVAAPRGAGVVLVAVLAVILAQVTVKRNEDYRSTPAFWSDIVTKRPDNPRARMWLGNYLYAQGRTADAYEHLSAAVRLRPEDGQAQYGLGVVLARQGKMDEAIERYRTSLRLDPKNASAHNNLGIALADRRQTDEAIEHYREAIRISPEHSGAHYNLALALAGQGRVDEAIAQLEAALSRKPDFPEARRALEDFRSRAAR